MAEPSSTEARLRDKLAEHLEVLEPGLTLRSIEYRLPNRQADNGEAKKMHLSDTRESKENTYRANKQEGFKSALAGMYVIAQRTSE
jgi:hypothetical protein